MSSIKVLLISIIEALNIYYINNVLTQTIVPHDMRAVICLHPIGNLCDLGSQYSPRIILLGV